ncbi:hypothetical protein [Hydrogenophaga sp. RWCD_12]|uniref:hypothetical protein n=1 Tax=Hydrogenophaga sp. RWCD_12 TaxID=3391190 RepID=UPI003984B604
MNPNTHALRSAHEDSFVINEATRHHYYSTMQAEVYDEDMLDAALNRRQARAMVAKRDHRRVGVWLAVLSVCALAGLLWALN